MCEKVYMILDLRSGEYLRPYTHRYSTKEKAQDSIDSYVRWCNDFRHNLLIKEYFEITEEIDNE